MIHRFLAYLTIIIHIIWILFLIFGFIFALRKSRIAILHVAGLLFTLILNLGGFYCPLTSLENYLYTWKDSGSVYAGSFIYHFLNSILYPEVPESCIRIFGASFSLLYTAGYIYLAVRYRIIHRYICQKYHKKPAGP